MTQDERWIARYNEVKAFIETNHRNPSRYIPAERGKYINWLKHTKEQYSADELKLVGVKSFDVEYKLVNQYK